MQECLQQLDLYGRRNAPLQAKNSDSWFRMFAYMTEQCKKTSKAPDAAHNNDVSNYNQNVERICRHYNALQILREVLLSITFTNEARNLWSVDSPYNRFDVADAAVPRDAATANRNNTAQHIYIALQNATEKKKMVLALLKLIYCMSNCTLARKEFFQNGYMIILFSIALAPLCMCFKQNITQHTRNVRHQKNCVKNCAETKAWLENEQDIRCLAANILCNMCHCDALKELIGSVSGATRVRAFVAIAEHSLQRNETQVCGSALAALRNLTTNRSNARILGALRLYGRILQLLRTLFAAHEKRGQLRDACEHILVIFLNASRSVRAVDCITLQTTELFKTLANVCQQLHGNLVLYKQFEHNCDQAADKRAKNQFDSSDEGSLDEEELLDNDQSSISNQRSAAAATDDSSAYAETPTALLTQQKKLLTKQQHQQQRQQRLSVDERLLESAQVFVQEQKIVATTANSSRESGGSRLLQQLRIECVLPQFDYNAIQTEQNIGKGTYSTVYSAVYHGYRIAAKVLKTALPQNLIAREKLLLEFRLMSMLRHPNIVQLMGISCTPSNQLVVCTELCSRGCLKQNLEKTNDMILRIRFAKDIIAGLNWLHVNRVVHRDLKPANLLVREDYSVVVADFGLSLYIGSSAARRPVSRHFKGNVKYSAPEILQLRALKTSHRGHQTYQYSPATDVYAFALILWEILTPQQKLFGHIKSGRTGITEFVVSGGRPRLVQGWPASLCTLLQRCWHADPQRRLLFDRIQQQFDAVVIDFLCPDVLGRTLARRLWHTDQAKAVRYSQWEAEFEDVTRVKLQQLPNGNDYRHCLQFMLCDKFGQRPLVTFERFCNMLQYLGSLTPINRFLENMLSLFKQGWFFGFIRKEEAASLLAQALQQQRNALGYFLIRFSVTHKGSYVIHLINRDGQLFQRIIAHQFSNSFTVALDEVHPVEYETIFQLLRECTECETCLQGMTPLDSSPFTKYLSNFTIQHMSTRHSSESTNSAKSRTQMASAVAAAAAATHPRTTAVPTGHSANRSLREPQQPARRDPPQEHRQQRRAQHDQQEQRLQQQQQQQQALRQRQQQQQQQLERNNAPTKRSEPIQQQQQQQQQQQERHRQQRHLAGRTISLVSAARSASVAASHQTNTAQRSRRSSSSNTGANRRRAPRRSKNNIALRNANNSALLKFL